MNRRFLGSAAMQAISFMNMKGGVGKTTIAVNVAYGLAALHDKKVLMVDCDPQFNATQYLLEDEIYLRHIEDRTKGTIKDIFMPRSSTPVRTVSGSSRAVNRDRISLRDCALQIYDGSLPPGGMRTGRGRLDLLPSVLDLVEVQNSSRGTENRLKNFINEKASHYDYVIIDCPPTISIFTQAAILASHKYVVPIKPDPLSVLGLPLLERYIGDFTSDFGMNIEQAGIILTLVRRPTSNTMKAVMTELRQSRGASVFSAVSTVADSVSRSVEDHKPLIYFQKASQQIRAQFIDITSEFIRRTGG